MACLAARLTAIVSGALLTLSFAPFDFWPASFISLTGLAYLLFKAPQHSIQYSWLFGIGLFGTGSSWVYTSIHDHGNAGVGLALFLVCVFTVGLSLFLALFGLAFKRINHHNNTATPFLLFAALWVLFEWLRSWLLTGFPWLFVGYGHTGTWFSHYVPVFGVYGASFAVALISASIAKLAIGRKLTRDLSFALIIIIACFPLSLIAWTSPTNKPLAIGAVQPNLSLNEKWDRNNLGKILYQLQQQTMAVDGSDIVVWPEAAIPANYQSLSTFVTRLIERANDKGYTLIAGMPFRQNTDTNKRYYNSQWVSKPDSLEPNFYFKQHLVPFGEYMPFESLLRGTIDFFDLPSSHFSSGAKNQPQLFAAGQPIAIYICYEVAFPDLVARNARTATVLFTTSNDSWFGDSIGPKQHYQIAATRALENAKPMVRVTNNGVTGFIDHHGRTTAAIKPFKQLELIGKVQPMLGITPFSRFGSRPIVLICLLIVVTSLAYRGRGSENSKK